jgi:predicted ATPase
MNCTESWSRCEALFASGKFDQYKRDIPYATFAQAFQGVVRELLGKTDEELNGWRRDLLDGLGSNGQLMADLIPELGVIIGDQPPVPDLPPQDRQNRFHLVFRRFIRAIARPEHPLALFLDDLQWADTASLALIQHLAATPDTNHLFLVGAYRDNEVDSAHPLARTIENIEKTAPLLRLTLGALTTADLSRILADALQTTADCVLPWRT